MRQKTAKYIDDYQNIHFSGKELGKGGQGVVFRTKDPDLAIKLVTDGQGTPLTDAQSLEKYHQRFKLVRLLPFPERIHISVPVAILPKNAGYVMQLLSEMVPFSSIWPDGNAARNVPKGEIPVWLSGMKEEEAKKIVLYYSTGGLRRRLTALYACASILARLHAKSLVYGDISPNNIFLSEEGQHLSVWLIDADNIRFECKGNGGSVFTPKYGAPELVQGADVARPQSDCFSFAVVAFYMLSMLHPFSGKKVDGSDDEDWADTEVDEQNVEEQADAGLIPWVDDQKDDSNSSEGGLPRSLILTPKLVTLFEQTFSPGRTSPELRPSIFHWPEALAHAADTTIICPTCKMSYYYDSRDVETDTFGCPYCETPRPQILMLESYRWGGEHVPLQAPIWRFVRELTSNSAISIPKRVFSAFSMQDSDIEEIMITPSDKGLLITRSDTGSVDLLLALDDKGYIFKKLYAQMTIEWIPSAQRFWMHASSSAPRLILCTILGAKQ